MPHPEENVQEKVGPEEVRRIARLARLQFSEEEAETLAGELERILGYMRRLGDVDTAGVEPMRQPMTLDAAKPLRPDEARQRISREEALENAPDATDDGHFRAPSAME